MDINASYITLEYIKSAVESMITPDTFELYPGKFNASSSDVSSGTYTVVQNVDIGVPYIKADAISLTMYHQEFDIIQDITSELLPLLNVQNARDNANLYIAGINEDIRFLSVAARVSRNDHNNFIEGTEYYVVSIDILIQYVDLAGQANLRSRHKKQSAYVSA